MADSRVAKTISVDELAESLTTATLRAIKSEHPALDVAKTGVSVSFRIWMGIPAAAERVAAEAGGAVTLPKT